MNMPPIIYSTYKNTFDLDEEGWFHIRPDWFNDDGDFTATLDQVDEWLASDEGKNRLAEYFYSDLTNVVDDNGAESYNWEFTR